MSRYVNGSVFVRSDLLLSVICPGTLFAKYSEKFTEKYQDLTGAPIETGSPERVLSVNPYQGNNKHVQAMIQYLNQHLRDDLYGAYVHGSLGTGDEIAYSDFDALVILLHDVFESPGRLQRVARKLNAARAIMVDFDPLQHHGWFTLTEAHLNRYPEHYFPLVLFDYAKSLLSHGGDLKMVVSHSTAEMRQAFQSVVDGVIGKLERKCYPTNTYELKSLLSEFMLIPTLYLQAKNEEGVFKKESFRLARKDFPTDDWTIMDEVSEIRSEWKSEISLLKRWIMSRANSFGRYYAKRFAPAIPPKLQRKLTSAFYIRMKNLAILMKKKIDLAKL